jgi:hypothetical protein
MEMATKKMNAMRKAISSYVFQGLEMPGRGGSWLFLAACISGMVMVDITIFFR